MVKPGEVVRCPSCGSELGVLVPVGEQLWLSVRGIEMRYMHGRCTCCSKIFHFDSTPAKLLDLVTRYRQLAQS